jgi:hypothetical protein
MRLERVADYQIAVSGSAAERPQWRMADPAKNPVLCNPANTHHPSTYNYPEMTRYSAVSMNLHGQASMACDSCKGKKRKCDKRLPKCTLCSR